MYAVRALVPELLLNKSACICWFRRNTFKLKDTQTEPTQRMLHSQSTASDTILSKEK